LLLTGKQAAQTAPPLTDTEYGAVRRLVKPAADEDKWAQVPWLSSLWQARQRAAALGKPILLWEMDGHPLGCT
jgi:hypothetical protein